MSGITLMMLGNFALAGGVSPASLWGWGDNYAGAAARNSTEAGGRYSSPVQLGSATDWLDVEGSYNFVGTRSSGYLYNCGDARFGAWNTSLNTSSPIQIGSLTNWIGGGAMLAQESSGAKAIKSDGTLWSWGDNEGGSMGINQNPNDDGDAYKHYSSPIQVGSLTNWTFTTGGGYSGVLAVNSSGELYAWGSNSYGNLGNGNRLNVSSPIQIGSLTTWSTGASGNGIAMFLKTDGTAWVWGGNDYGQLGIGAGTSSDRSSPVQLGSETDWTVASCGYQNMAGIRGGKLYSWGRNSNGGVGDGTVVQRNSPVQIGALTTWLDVQTGNQMAVALKTDGKLYAWGANYQGQAGQNNVIKYSSPVQIGSLTDWSRIHLSTSSSATCWALKA